MFDSQAAPHGAHGCLSTDQLNIGATVGLQLLRQLFEVDIRELNVLVLRLLKYLKVP